MTFQDAVDPKDPVTHQNNTAAPSHPLQNTSSPPISQDMHYTSRSPNLRPYQQHKPLRSPPPPPYTSPQLHPSRRKNTAEREFEASGRTFSDLDRMMSRESSIGRDGTERDMEIKNKGFKEKLLALMAGTLNFYRIHLLVFTFTPLITSGIFYAINTQYHIDYIDSLFLCVSSITVTGLATNNLSQLSGTQQAMLFVQMLFGSPVFISLIMITVRKYFFRQEFDHMIQRHRKAQREKDLEGRFDAPLRKIRRFSQTFHHEKPDVPVETTAKTHLRWTDLFKSGEKKTKKDMEEKDGSDGSQSDEVSPPNGWKLNGMNAISGDTTLVDSMTMNTREGRTLVEGDEEQRDRAETEQQRERPSMGRTHTGWFGLGGGEAKIPKPKLRTDMIKRVEGGGVGLVNPMGWYHSPGNSGNQMPVTPHQPGVEPGPSILGISGGSAPAHAVHDGVDPLTESPHSMHSHLPAHESDGADPLSSAPYGRKTSEPTQIPKSPTIAAMEDKFPRTRTIAFDRAEEPTRMAYTSARDTTGMYGHTPGTGAMPRTGTMRSMAAATYSGNPLERTATGRRSMSGTTRGMPQTATFNSGMMPRTKTINQTAKNANFGGFPTPFQIAKAAFNKAFPDTGDKIKRTLTIQAPTGTGSVSGGIGEDAKPVPYISFDAIVGRNSHFHDLTREEQDELGGVEYRALRVLFWIVLTYYLMCQFACFIMMAPYTAANYQDDLQPSTSPQFRFVPPYWFAAFQAVSAFSNTGMSLVDLSMLPFQKAYLLIFPMFFLIYAGNTAFPIFLRFVIWVISRTVPAESRVHETLKFLLDHPRRCFVYLFPSTQTWFLFLVMITLTLTDWVCFLVLDIGNPVIEAIPVGTRLADGLLQAAAVRAAGFAIVPLASLAPAVKVLFTIMQYISVYPIAMSIRATNVYEEKSLGVWNDDEDEEEPQYQGGQAVAKYLGWHARRQLAFDIWWLALALWLICIIERGKLNDENASWFNIFQIIFELVSAYGTVGLSLGVNYDNFSFVGAFSPLAKLVVIAVMIRGRHRGLPVAIDRAIMLPKDFQAAEDAINYDEADRLTRRATRRASSIFQPGFGPFDSAGLPRASSGDDRGPPASPTTGRRSLDRMSAGRSESGRLDRSPERPFTFRGAGGGLDANGLPRSLSMVEELSLSRAPTLANKQDSDRQQ